MKVKITTLPNQPPTDLEQRIIMATVQNAFNIAKLALLIQAQTDPMIRLTLTSQAMDSARRFADSAYPELGIRLDISDEIPEVSF